MIIVLADLDRTPAVSWVVLGLFGLYLAFPFFCWVSLEVTRWQRRRRLRLKLVSFEVEAAEVARLHHSQLSGGLDSLLAAYSISCNRCRQNAVPIPGTGNRYRCNCGRQFANSRHGIDPIPNCDHLRFHILNVIKLACLDGTSADYGRDHHCRQWMTSWAWAQGVRRPEKPVLNLESES